MTSIHEEHQSMTSRSKRLMLELHRFIIFPLNLFHILGFSSMSLYSLSRHSSQTSPVSQRFRQVSKAVRIHTATHTPSTVRSLAPSPSPRPPTL